MTFTFALAIALSQIQDAPFEAPGPNKIAWAQSPNFGPRPTDAPIDTIVLHHTASSNLGGVVKWFTMPESQVSAHYTIGKDGSIVQHVSTFDRAWHAGNSQDYFGRTNVNNFSIGIEIVNKGDGSEPWTEPQVRAVYLVCAHLIRYRFPEIKQITSHEFIAIPLGRKNDPLNYPWDSLKDLGVPIYVDTKLRPDQKK